MAIIVLRTARLDIGLLTPEESHLLKRYLLLNEDHLAPWEPVRDPSYTTDFEIKLRIKSALLGFKQQSAFHFVILNKAHDEVLGVCNFANAVRGALQACHLGYAISVDHQGQGLMPEALKVCIEYMFKEQKFHRIMANYIPTNHRSENVLTSLGFKREGYSPAYLKIAGRWQDHVLTALINPAD